VATFWFNKNGMLRDQINALRLTNTSATLDEASQVLIISQHFLRMALIKPIFICQQDARHAA